MPKTGFQKLPQAVALGNSSNFQALEALWEAFVLGFHSIFLCGKHHPIEKEYSCLMSKNINGDKNKINSEINTGILSENITHHLPLAVGPFL